MLERKTKKQIAKVREGEKRESDYIGSFCILVWAHWADLSMGQLFRRCILPTLPPVTSQQYTAIT